VEEGTTVVIEDNSNNQSGKVEAGTDAGFENNGTINIEGGTIGEGAIENNGTVNVNGGTIEEDAIDHNENATIGQYVYTVAELQAAIDAAKDTATETGLNKIEIGFGADIEGDVDVYIAQKEGVNLTINGRGFKFNRGFIVDGQNRATGTDTVLITNINFYTEENTALTFVSLPGTYNGLKERYSHNVTIDGCTFAAATLSENVGAINAQKTYHLAVKNCTATNLHSLLQVQSCDNDVTVENVKVVNCKSGISVGNTKTTKITNAQIAAQKYGVRLDGAGERKVEVTIARSSIEAYAPVVARKVTAGCDVKVDVTGTTLKNIDGLYDIVIAGNKDYEDGNITPTTPEGTWEVVGADSYIVFPIPTR
ncbi:MAG: hypothetical protein E7146_01675, partial [Rikenellaceae bacterium]|nr:hypothetical protein [Rikenellaceae bacterium]